MLCPYISPLDNFSDSFWKANVGQGGLARVKKKEKKILRMGEGQAASSHGICGGWGSISSQLDTVWILFPS